MDAASMPSRGSLVVECARVIRLRIADGEWQEFLPGERAIAKTLEVGRDTVRLALQLLERDGVLGPPQPGSKRIIQISPSPQAHSKNTAFRIGILSSRPLEFLTQPMLFEVDHLRRALATRGDSLDLFSPSWFGQRNLANRLAQLVAEEPCNAWILLRSSAELQQWFVETKTPCLVRGYPHPGIDLPHLDLDWEATARHAAGRLWRLGHQTVGIFSPMDALAGVRAAVKGATELGEPGFQAIEIPENGTSEGMAMILSRVLNLRKPPTALITTRARQFATALTWLASHGVRVPQQVSLISLAYEPFLDHLLPTVSGYKTDPEAVSKQVLRRIESMMQGGHSRRSTSWFTPETVKGASIAEAP